MPSHYFDMSGGGGGGSDGGRVTTGKILSFILCRTKSGMMFYKLLKVSFNVSQNLLQWHDVSLGV